MAEPGPAVGRLCEGLAVPRARRRLYTPQLDLPAPGRWEAAGVGPHSPLSDLLQPPLARLVGADGPLAWPHPLRPFQVGGVALLLERPAVLLADDMGLGKTVQGAAALRILAWRGAVRSALIVAPTSLLAQWARELRIWAPELTLLTVRGPIRDRVRFWRARASVHLAGYETIRSDVWPDSPLLRRQWDLVVLDEASRIKNPYAAVTAACRQLAAPRRWALTGTPLENVAGDVTSILRFVQPDAPPIPGDTPSLLRRRLAEVQLRRRKAEVLPELPPKHVIELPLELAGRQRAAYDRAEHEGILELTALGDRLRISHILELILRLKQLCNVEPVTGQSVKIDDLLWRLEQVSQAGHRALVFSQFTDSRFGLGHLAHHLADLRPLLFTGRLSLAERERAAQQFRDDERHRVLLLSLRAGGLGLNLQAASYVFHLDRWWNPAVEGQAEDRSHRIGQQWPVTCYRYLCLNTIEERIDELIQIKRQRFRDIIEPVSLDPRRFTKAELLRLLDVRGRLGR